MPEKENNSADETLSGRDPIRTAIVSLLQKSQRTLLIFADDLDTSIYSNDLFTEQLSTLARKSRQSDIRLLLHRPAELFSQQHRALALIQRLSSLIEVKKLHEQYHNQQQCFVINDQPSMLYQASSERYEAILTNDLNRITEMKQQFEQMWQQSTIATELRRQLL